MIYLYLQYLTCRRFISIILLAGELNRRMPKQLMKITQLQLRN